MTVLTVTVTQWDARPASYEAQFDALCRHLAAHPCDLVLLPEMPFDQWLCAQETPDPARWAEAVQAHQAWQERLAALPATLVSTRPIIAADGRRLNRAYALTGGRCVDIHDKYYLPCEPGFWEAHWYDRGDGTFQPVRLGPALVGVQICTEMWFQAEARAYMKAGIDLVCVPRATGPGSLDKWLAGGRAAAVVAGAYCLSSNLWLPAEVQGPEDLGGMGWIIDPDGEVLATTSRDQPFRTLSLDLTTARQAKASYPRYVRD